MYYFTDDVRINRMTEPTLKHLVVNGDAKVYHLNRQAGQQNEGQDSKKEGETKSKTQINRDALKRKKGGWDGGVGGGEKDRDRKRKTDRQRDIIRQIKC